MFNNKIKAIIFDLGNVLIDVRWDLCLNIMRKDYPDIDIKFNNFFKEKVTLFQNYEMGKVSDDLFLDEIKKFTGVNYDDNYLAKIISEIFIKKENIINSLPTLKNNYKLYMLSNTSSLHRIYGWGDYDFVKYFDHLFLSYEIGYIKPMDEIYQFVEGKINLNTDEFIYFDDIKQYIEAAKKRNWNAFQLTNENDYFEVLKKFNIEI